MTDTLFLAEITVYDASISSTRVLRYASGLGHVTGPAETPASTFYDGKITQPSDLTRDLFDSGTTLGRSRVGFGDLVLANDDGALDGLLEYAFDGWPITIRQGTVGAAYPAGFPAVFIGTMAQAEVSASAVTIKLRDRQAETDVPFQPTKYAGSNALPAGLEGVATDLKGKPKPIVMGSVSNVAPPCVNTSKLIYQVHDGAVSSVPAVYDRGVALGVAGVWTLRHTLGGSNIFYDVRYNGSLYVAVGGDGAVGIIYTSPDGVTWTSRTSPAVVTRWEALAWSGTLWVIGGGAGNVATSPDGITWTSRGTLGAGAMHFKCAWHSTAALFCLVGLSGVYTSPDGIAWTQRLATTTFHGVCYGAGIFVIVGSAGTISTSPDGVTWTARTTNITAGSIAAVAYANSLFIGVGAISSRSFVSSADGFTWTALDNVFGSLAGANCIAYSTTAGGWFIGGADGYTATSPTGVTWQVRAPAAQVWSATTDVMECCVGASGEFVAVLDNQTLYQATARTYASLVELADDTKAPNAGGFIAYPAGGYFRLGATPAGTITADVIEGTTASDRTAAQCFKRALVRAGKSAGDYSASDLTALDALTTDVLGLYVDEEAPLSDVLTQIAASVGAWWGVDKAGVFRIQQFRAPTTTPVATFTANDLKRPLDRQATNDLGGGLPVFKSIVRWGRKYTVQATDLAGSVTDTRRAELAKEWREASATVASVQTAHPLSPQLVEDSLLTTEAGAQAEATRRQALRGVRRDRYPIVVAFDATTAVIDLNDVVELMHARFDLMAVGEAGKLFRVIGVQPDAKNREVTFVLWGPSQGLANRVTDTGAYRVTDTGAYRITAAE